MSSSTWSFLLNPSSDAMKSKDPRLGDNNGYYGVKRGGSFKPAGAYGDVKRGGSFKPSGGYGIRPHPAHQPGISHSDMPVQR